MIVSHTFLNSHFQIVFAKLCEFLSYLIFLKDPADQNSTQMAAISSQEEKTDLIQKYLLDQLANEAKRSPSIHFNLPAKYVINVKKD